MTEVPKPVSVVKLYQEANKLYEEGSVTLEEVLVNKERGFITFLFVVGDHNVSLKVVSIEGSKQYEREWGCDCKHMSLFVGNPKVFCKHVIACELFLANE